MLRKSLSKNLLSISRSTKFIFVIGFLLVVIPIIFHINEGIQLAYFTPHVPPTVLKIHTTSLPTRVVIPGVDIDLPISETAISGNVWEIASNGISHLDISSRPGEKGPIILYGHNTNDRFGPIRWLTVGKKIEVTTMDLKIHTYTIIKTMDVSPSETNIFNQKSETLILYTCEGFADLQRFVVIATPSSGNRQ